MLTPIRTNEIWLINVFLLDQQKRGPCRSMRSVKPVPGGDSKEPPAKKVLSGGGFGPHFFVKSWLSFSKQRVDKSLFKFHMEQGAFYIYRTRSKARQVCVRLLALYNALKQRSYSNAHRRQWSQENGPFITLNNKPKATFYDIKSRAAHLVHKINSVKQKRSLFQKAGFETHLLFFRVFSIGIRQSTELYNRRGKHVLLKDGMHSSVQ
jgi:hypothetical protein